MSRALAVLWMALSLSAWAGASSADPLAPVTSTGNAAEKALSALVSEYARGYFAFDPAFATTWGLHACDRFLPDRSRAAIDREVARTRKTLASAKALPVAQLGDS